MPPLRNDRWLVSHPRHLLESWQANIDFQLTLDIDKVLKHMTKCVAKCEGAMTKGIAAMMRNTLRKTIADGLSVQTALKRVMGKTLGQRMLSKQQTTHLMLSLPMVSCSHVFALINLDDNQNLISMPPTTNENTNGVIDDTITGDNESGNNTSENNPEVNTVTNTGVRNATITKKSVVEMCGLRMDKNHWLNEGLHNHHESGLQNMTLRDFL